MSRPLPPRADVVIIGAGLAGTSVAGWLDGNQTVLIVEQGAQPGGEASAQNAGMVRRLGEDPAERALAVRTHELLCADPELAHASRRTGAVLALAHDPWHLHDGVAALRARGVHIEACDRPAELAPVLADAHLVQAWHLPDERVADAWSVVSTMLKRATSKGATLACDTAVIEILHDNTGVCGVRTSRGTVATRCVVVAAGAWTARLLPKMPVIPIRRTLLQSAPHGLSQPGHPWTWIDDVGVYVRPEGGGWLCSGCDETPEAVPQGAGSRGRPGPTAIAIAQHKLEQHMPALAGLRWTHGWTGLRTFAPDRRPLVGPDPAQPGLWWLAGLGGFGVSCGLAAGEALSRWIQGEDVDWLRKDDVDPGRDLPRRWPVRFNGDIARARLISAENRWTAAQD